MIIHLRSLVLCVCFVDRFLSFFFWPLCCLFFFYLRVLITPLVSNSSCIGNEEFVNGMYLILGRIFERTKDFNITMVFAGCLLILTSIIYLSYPMYQHIISLKSTIDKNDVQETVLQTQISEQKILMWFLSHNIPKRNKLAEQISQKNPEYMLNYSLPYSCS